MFPSSDFQESEMKAKFKVGALMLAMVSPAWGQLVSSHAPTAPAPPSANAEAAQPAAKPVVRVNGKVLTDRDLVREEYTIFPYARQHNGVPAGLEADIRVGALKMIEFEELVYQEAVRRGLSIAPERLRKAELEFRKQFTGPQQYDEALKSEFKGSTAVLRSKIKRSLLIEDLLKLEVDDKSVVSIAQARGYYDKNPQRFQYPEAFVFQSISFLPGANASPAQLKEAHKRAEDALHQLGFPQVRVRHHGNLARIEIERADLARALSLDMLDKITAALKPVGFLYITIDTQGYRSGSMNLALPDILPISAITRT